MSFLSYFHSRTLQSDPVYVIDGVAIKEGFFLVSPFWSSPTFSAARNKSDFFSRGITGFIRSSPNYNFEPAKKISKAYFDGLFNEDLQSSLKEIDPDCELLNEVINCVKDEQGNVKTFDSLKIKDRFFIDVLLAYIHSPLQTRSGRTPLNNQFQERFNEILKNISLTWYVEKVDANRLPRRKLVGLRNFISFHIKSIFLFDY